MTTSLDVARDAYLTGRLTLTEFEARVTELYEDGTHDEPAFRQAADGGSTIGSWGRDGHRHSVLLALAQILRLQVHALRRD